MKPVNNANLATECRVPTVFSVSLQEIPVVTGHRIDPERPG